MTIGSFPRFFRSLLVCSLLTLGLLVVGCDSSGSGGGGGDGNLSGSVTAELNESSSSALAQAKASIDGEFVASFRFNPGTSDECVDLDRRKISGETPINEELEPIGTCEGDDFDEVEVSYVPSSGSASGLSLRVMSGGETVASSSSADAAGNLSATASDAVDDGGDDGGGDDGGGDDGGGDDGGGNGDLAFTGNWEVTEFDGESPPFELFFSITSEQVEIISPNENVECDVETIVSVDGNTVTTEGSDGETGTGTVAVSNDGTTLTIEGLVENANTVTATRVDSVPDCQ